MRVLFLVTPIALFLTGCLPVGPNYRCPQTCVPDSWEQELTKGLEEGTPAREWWKLFNDPLLVRLIERADFTSLSLWEAYYRIQEARALRGIVRGQWFPAVNSNGDFSRERFSKEFPAPRGDNVFTLNQQRLNYLEASWEIDVWGRISREVEAATADVQASVENFRDVMVILYAEIANTYIEVRTLQKRINITRMNANTQRESLHIATARFNAELTSELDVFQAELNFETTVARIPTLESRLTAEMNRLGVLLGDFPSALHEELTPVVDIPEVPADITVGLPADLLRQRPDIRLAERQYAAQFALIGAAIGDLYPRFSLAGLLGYFGIADIFESSKRVWSYGANYFWRLFEGGSLRSAVNAQIARARQAKTRYEQSVLNGLEEVDTFMTAYVKELERKERLIKAVEASQKSVELVHYQYVNGLTSYYVVLVLERSLLEVEDQLADSEGLAVQNLIGIYRALGGGWCL